MAEKPRIIAEALRRLTTKLGQAQATLIFVNQVHETFKMFGEKQDTPGGHKIKFHSSTPSINFSNSPRATFFCHVPSAPIPVLKKAAPRIIDNHKRFSRLNNVITKPHMIPINIT